MRGFDPVILYFTVSREEEKVNAELKLVKADRQKNEIVVT